MVFNVGLDNLEFIGKQLDRYGYAAEQAIEDGFKEFATRFRFKLEDNMARYGVPESIVENLQVVIESTSISIYVSGEEMLYFEYGTGIVGSQNPHPNPINWTYDINDHGDRGWIYVPTENYHLDYATEIYPTRNGTLIARTRGMEANPFLYDTWLWGKRSVVNIIRKHINRLEKR